MLAVELGLPLYCLDVEKKHRLDGVGGTLRLITQYNERIQADREQQQEGDHARKPSSASKGEMQGKRGVGEGVEGKGGEVTVEEVYMPITACDIFDEDDLFSRLTALLIEHSAVDVWVIRMDEDREGRGVAWVEVPTIPGLKALLTSLDVDEEEREEQVEALLVEQLMERVQLLHPSFYASTDAFFNGLYLQGGTIIPYPSMPSYAAPLTSPSVHMLIEPNGQLTMQASMDVTIVRPFSPLLSSFPSTYPGLHQLAAVVGKACWREGVIGHVSIDFLSMPSSLVYAPPAMSLVPPTLPPTVLVPVTVHLHCTAGASGFALFHFLMQGRYLWRGRLTPSYRVMRPGVKEAREEEQRLLKLEKRKKFHRTTPASIDQHTRPTTQPNPTTGAPLPPPILGRLTRPLPQAEGEEERFYALLPMLQLQPLSTLPLSSFFALCRVKQLSFDVGERKGLCFLLYGSMGAGRLGVLGVGEAREEAARRVEAVLRLMEEEWKGRSVVGDADVDPAYTNGEVAELRNVMRAVKTVGRGALQGKIISRFPAISQRSNVGSTVTADQSDVVLDR